MISTPQLLDALGIQDLTPPEQEEMLVELNEVILKGAMIRILEHIDEPTKTDMETLLSEDATEEELERFMEERIPGADQAVLDTIEELTNDILAVTGESPNN